MAWVQWICRNCGKKESKLKIAGRPQPGKCPRNNGRPHSWVKNREL